MNIGGFLAVFQIAGKFSRAYSKAVKAEHAKDGDVNWLDYLSCIFEALGSMDESDLDVVVAVSRELKK